MRGIFLDLNSLSTIVWFFSAFFFLLNTLVIARGKRIIKQSKVILEFINLMILFYVFQQISSYSVSLQYVLLAVMIGVLISIISGFFTGDYRVYTENKELLLKSVDSALASVMSIRAVQQEKKNCILFILKEINKKIEVIETETISDKKTYRIKFKRWTNHDLKKQILTQVNDELENYDDFPIDRQMITLKIVGAILLMVISLFVTSYSVMEKRQINFVEEPIPHELYFFDNNFNYTDEDVIYKIHECLEDTYSHRFKEITYDDAIEETKYVFEYGIKGKTIYVGHKRVYIYVPDSKIGNKSPLHWIFWKLHNIYDKSEGTYYISFRVGEMYEIIKGIVEH